MIAAGISKGGNGVDAEIVASLNVNADATIETVVRAAMQKKCCVLMFLQNSK